MRKTMSLHWEKQTFQSLKKCWRNGEHRPGWCECEYALIGRYGEILYMLDRDGIF
jgi:hypothetical protein